MPPNLLSSSLLLFFVFLFTLPPPSNSQSFIGINYGQVADNLPPPNSAANLLQSTTIGKVRLYNSDPTTIKAFANTDIELMIGISNSDINGLASDPNLAKTWLNSNVLPFYPSTKITVINIGNEVMSYNDRTMMTQLLPAMRNLQNALHDAGLGGKVKVSTVHSMAILRESDPPSSGRFDPTVEDLLKGLLDFNSETGSPFLINPYPYFAYRSDPRPETLAFCLFKDNPGRVDSGTKIKYMNMFDAQLDAIRSALNRQGFKDVDIVVAETGWPYKGDTDEVGPSVENAKAYNGNLIAHLRSKVGAPLMPGKSVDTYLFALFDENLKPGMASERSFGLFKPDLTATYDVGLSKTSSQSPLTPKTPISPAPKPRSGSWCVPKQGVSDVKLQASLDYACGQGIDCGPIQPAGACFEPATVAYHAAYAMNLLYQKSGKNIWDCDYSQTAVLTSTNPSYKECVYPGGSS